ncbi:hypothetical protein BCV70DRAFT_200223 [Testicularia cyperi]|uniref:HCP-like protein n=1 Tax=Testicularia cyperi TaxID=1882483 RepID=A0A317XPL5_9BASI|nr:hypothetical protein BCV70DRAFT_200223 [Testicularia cyperi]
MGKLAHCRRQGSRSRRWPPLPSLFPVLLLLCHAAASIASDPENGAGKPVPTEAEITASTADASSASPGSSLASKTPQEAYDEALSLLRSTIKARPARTKSSRQSNGKQKAASTSPPPPSPPSSSSIGSAPATSSAPSTFTLLWDLLWTWTPLGTILRVISSLYRLSLDSIGFTSDTFPTEVIPSSARGTSDDKKWLGPPVGASKHELRWKGARPLPLWPDWERLGDGLVSESPEDSPWDTVMFGPFYGDEQEANNDTALLSFVPQLSTLTGSTRKHKKLSARTDTESKRARAVELLEWSGWGRSNIDWEREAYEASSRDEIGLLEHAFDQSNSNTTTNATSDSSGASEAFADALWVLGEHSLWGTHGAQPNLARARACYQRLIDYGYDRNGRSAAGNASAHARLAFLEGSGWESTMRGDWTPLPTHLTAPSSGSADEVRAAWRQRRETFAQLKRDDGLRQAKALVHYTVAAEAGHTPSQMALGFRYKAGIGVKPSCWTALKWYEMAAVDAYSRFEQGPPGGLTLPYTKLRISDLDGGVYGLGASAASTGYAAMKPSIRAALAGQPGSAGDPAALEDMLEYYIYHAEHGDVKGMLTIARVYYQGSIYGFGDSAGAVRRDYRKAMEYLLRITREVWPRDAGTVGRGGPTGWTAKEGDRGEDVRNKVDDALATQAGMAAGIVGRMYLRGEGVAQDFARAWVWFSRGQDTGDAASYNGVGVMLRDGLGVKRDVSKAVSYFEAAAKAGHGEASVNVAKVHLDLGDTKNALKALHEAVQAGSTFEAYHLIATINAQLARKESSTERCRAAVAGFKHTVERGDWSAPYSHKAERAWRRGVRQKALLGWALAGEMGFEAAQNNLAYVLDRDRRRLRIAAFDAAEDNSTDRLALIHWTRSAAQDNVDAMVKMGDYYFHGIGTGNPGQAAYEKAAACYSAAADRQVSALAYWNMGWMYEKGIGVARQDFHLAKRYYDMAVEVNEEAYLPVTLSLIKLHVRALWAALFRSDSSASAISLFSSYASTDSTSAAYNEAEEIALSKRKKAEERRMMDAISDEQGGGFGDPNEPETWSPRAHGDEDTDEELDDMIESGLLILALGALAYLAYTRQQVQMRLDRERRQQQQQPDQHEQNQAHPHHNQGGAGQTGRPNTWDPIEDQAANQMAGV